MLDWRLLAGCALGFAVASTGGAAPASGSGQGSGDATADASTAPPGPVYEETVTSARDLVEDVGTTRRIEEEDIRQESARTLGLPVGTIKSRLKRGRDALRGILIRRHPEHFGE